MNNNREEERMDWHLDKRVSIATLLAIVFQIVVFTVFIVNMDSRVTMLETRSVDPVKVAVIESNVAILDRDMTRLEMRTVANLEEIKVKLERIEKKLNP